MNKPDIREIDGKYYDFNPQNKSFIQTAAELKELGIKNYYFMLEIKNPRVLGIDPWKSNITPQEVTILMTEAVQNMWYYVRELARIRADSGVVPYGLHRGLAAALWSFVHGYDMCLCEPRQTWKTSGLIAGPLTWAFQTSMNLHMHFFGKDSDNTKRNLATMKDDIDLLPVWIRHHVYVDEQGKVRKNTAATEKLHNRNMKNDCTIHATANTAAKAESMARGASAAIIYYDEIEFTPFFDLIMSNSAPAFKTAMENARSVGKPYGRIMTTTPGNLDTKEGTRVYPIIKSMIPWTEKIYDMTPEEIVEYKEANREAYNGDPEHEKARAMVDIFYQEYHYYQVRKNFQWVKEQYALTGDKMATRREVLLQRLRGSSDSPIDAEDIEYFISNMKVSTNDLIINGKWKFRLYEHGQKDRYGNLPDFNQDIPYLIGIDPAGGGGGDNFAITIVNPHNLQIAAEFKNPYIGQTEAVKMLQSLIFCHIPNGVLCIERNSIGQYLIDYLMNTDLKANMYAHKNDRLLEQMVEESEDDYKIRSYSAESRKYGTSTGPKSKAAMFELLFKHIDSHREILLTEYLVNDMCKLVRVRTPSGGTTIKALHGEHDDNVMSYLHAIYVYYNGDNLAAYGIEFKELPRKHKPGEEDQVDDFELLDSEPEGVQINFTNGPPQYYSYEEEMRASEMKLAAKRKAMVNSSLRFQDPDYMQYSQSDDEDYGGSDLIDISPHFFDSMNGF